MAPGHVLFTGALAMCALWFPAVDCTASGPWYEGIASIKVFKPGDDVNSYAHHLYDGDMEKKQFSDKRYAMILRSGNYGDTEIPVGYYTALMGAGNQVSDVTIASFYTLDNPDVGNACDNFWRHVEGVTTTNPSIMWAASQAAPLRRIHVLNELHLSEEGSPHWSSGGFMGDSVVGGALIMGTQQQFLVRNAQLQSGAQGKSMNYVFVGTDGAPASSDDGKLTTVQSAPRIAAKPYLTEAVGEWKIAVPAVGYNVVGPSQAGIAYVDMAYVYVAREGDTADTINAGIQGKKGLLLTPALYGLDKPISITAPGFVVLGIGFPTLIPTHGNSAIEVQAQAPNVRIAAVLLEAGTPVTWPATSPLLLWTGSDGAGSDIFTRVGAFNYSRSWKGSCLKTRADVHVQIVGARVTLDNLWLWHADHDDCGGTSDQSYSRFGLVVDGIDVAVYGLKAEHMFDNLVLWRGEQGRVYLFQAELPYHVPSYPTTGAYSVDQNISAHTGFGLGAYQIGTYTLDTGFRVPPTADLTNVFTWVITGTNERFRSVVCTASQGMDHCMYGDFCNGNSCYVRHVGSGLTSLNGTTAIVV